MRLFIEVLAAFLRSNFMDHIANMAVTTLLQAFFLLIAVFFLKIILFDRNNTNKLPLPPGPKGLPLLGNVNDLPPPGSKEYLHWLNHKDLYGPISSLTVLGQTIVIIHNKSLAMELLEKRAAIHSGRPAMVFGMEMCGWSVFMSSLPYGSAYRLSRKLAYQEFGSKAAIEKYYNLQERVVGRFLWRANKDQGSNLLGHLQTEAAELILKATYGYNVEPHKNDPLVDLVDEAMEQFGAAIVPGKWAVDILPFLKHAPDWLPGTGFKKTARAWKKTLTDVIEIPFQYAKDQESHGGSESSFVSRLLHDQGNRKEKVNGNKSSNQELSKDESQAIKHTAASLYTGGADTTVSTMQSFFLAMAMHPSIQLKAQKELDRVIGNPPSRLPTFSDRDQLPHLNAIVEEAQRWHPIAPMGLPHATDKEDSINGYRIPKGSLLLPAIWCFTRDPSVYHDAEMFKPERFAEPYNEPYATNVTFGFGRRVCPGKLFADASLFLTFAQSLAVFDIRPGVDDGGKEVELVHGFTDGIIGRPTPFEVRLVIRSREHEELIEKFVERYPWEESGAGFVERMMI
jgi:cytochrome P450